MTTAEEAISSFLRRALEMDADEAEDLFAEEFPPGSEHHKLATEIWTKVQETRSRLRFEPTKAERDSLSRQGLDPDTLLRIGQGAEGFVYKVTQRNPKRIVAVKFLATVLSEGGAERLAREVELMSKVHHPDVAALYFAGSTEANRPYFVMEYVDGWDICRQCEDQGWDLDKRLRIMIRVCDAVGSLHKQNVIHRDLSPSNIVVTSAGAPKIIDFGIARMAHADWLDEWIERHLVEPAGGTPGYAAPELQKWRPVGTAADCFSLGKVLLELVVGKPDGVSVPINPSEGPISTDARKLGFPNEAALRRFLKGDLDAILLKATAVDPGLRYATAGEIAEDLRAFLEHRPVLAQPRSNGYEARLFVRRFRPWVIALAALMVSLVVMTVYAWSQKIRADDAYNGTLLSLTDEKAAYRRVDQAERDTRHMFENIKSMVDAMARIRAAQEQPRLFEAARLWLVLYDDPLITSNRLRLSFARKAFAAMGQLNAPHPRLEQLRAEIPELVKEANKEPIGAGDAIRGNAGLPDRDLWELNDKLFLAVLEIQANRKLSAPPDVKKYLSSLPGNQDPGLQAVRETACGQLPAQVDLRNQIPSLKQLCK